MPPCTAETAASRALLLLGPDLSGCTLSLGAWSGTTSGLFTLPATMVCPLLLSLGEELGAHGLDEVAEANVEVPCFLLFCLVQAAALRSLS